MGVMVKNYEYSVGNGVTITNYTGPWNDVVIPDRIEGQPVTTVGDWAFYERSKLTNIIIPGSVTTIGIAAFQGCTNLTNVVIPDNVTDVGDWAFSRCANLTSIRMGNNVISIGWGAFSGCTRLTNITIPNSVTSIGPGAFAGCIRLTNITIPNSINRIGLGAFWDCSKLKLGTLKRTHSNNEFTFLNSSISLNAFLKHNYQFIKNRIENAMTPLKIVSIEDKLVIMSINE
jgi:hypothetical protein